MWVMNMNSTILFVLSVIAFAAFLRSLVVAVFRSPEGVSPLPVRYPMKVSFSAFGPRP